jgi:hypothetical protein
LIIDDRRLSIALEYARQQRCGFSGGNQERVMPANAGIQSGLAKFTLQVQHLV